MKILVAITGASGAIYGKRFLEVCRELGIETELIISSTGEKIIKYEIGESKENLEKLAAKVYSYDDLTSPPASGSYRIDAMVIIPCTMGKLAKIANGITDDLIARGADVCLKQNRPLVLVIRETPLNLVHLENMLKVCRAGGIVLPASPAFYHKPKDIASLVDFVVGKVLDALNIPHNFYERWAGIP